MDKVTSVGLHTNVAALLKMVRYHLQLLDSVITATPYQCSKVQNEHTFHI